MRPDAVTWHGPGSGEHRNICVTLRVGVLRKPNQVRKARLSLDDKAAEA